MDFRPALFSSLCPPSIADSDDDDGWNPYLYSLIRRAWISIRQLNRTRQDRDDNFQKWAYEFDKGKALPMCGLPEDYGSKYSSQNSSNPFGWLRDLWTSILTSARPNPISPIWPFPPSFSINIQFPKIDIGWLPKISWPKPPDFEIFRKVWDSILHKNKPVEPYQEPSDLQEALERTGEKLVRYTGGPEHQKGEMEAEQWLKQRGEKWIYPQDRLPLITPLGGKYYVVADFQSEHYIVDVKTGFEHMGKYQKGQLEDYLKYAEKTGKKVVYYIVNDPERGPYAKSWKEFISILEAKGVIIVHGSGWEKP